MGRADDGCMQKVFLQALLLGTLLIFSRSRLPDVCAYSFENSYTQCEQENQKATLLWYGKILGMTFPTSFFFAGVIRVIQICRLCA